MQRWSYISAGVYIFFSVVPIPFVDFLGDVAFIYFAILRFSLLRDQTATQQSERKRMLAISSGFVAVIAAGVFLSIFLPMLRSYPFSHDSFELARCFGAVYVAGALIYFVRQDQNQGAIQPPQPTALSRRG